MFKQSRVSVDEATTGRVYVFRFKLKGVTVYKVGMCHSDRTVDRFMEVLRGFFNVYRYVPEAKIMKFKEFSNPILVEQHLHKELRPNRYKFDKKFGGSTEFFVDIDADALVDYIENFKYEELLRCSTLTEKNYKAISKEIDVKLDYGGENEIPF